jgi:DNA-binding GntR family transcriptional regulator
MAVRQLKSEVVYDTLRDRIMDGTYGAGYRLVFDQLAGELGVSPVPVREATRRLEAEGLVEFTPNRGAQIAAISVKEYTEAMEMMAYLEGAATALAARHLRPGHLVKAQDINNQLRSLVNTRPFAGAMFSTLNGDFHSLLFSMCPNSHLTATLEHEQRRLALIRRGGYSVDRERAATSVGEHDDILALIITHADPLEIESAAKGHKLNTMRYYLDHQVNVG